MSNRNNMKRKGRRGLTALLIVKKFFPGVTRVEDARRPVMVEVTPQDSQESVVLDHSHCALAVACKRSFAADGVIVGTKTLYIIRGHQAVRHRLNESAAREIVSFDRRAGFAPGKYVLRAPSEYEQIGRDTTGQTRNPSGRKGPSLKHVTANIRTVLGSAGVTAETTSEAQGH